MRNLGFKPEGERMAVYQSHGESQNRRELGRKGNMFSWAKFSQKKDDGNTLEVVGNKETRLNSKLGTRNLRYARKILIIGKGKLSQGVSLEKMGQ